MDMELPSQMTKSLSLASTTYYYLARGRQIILNAAYVSSAILAFPVPLTIGFIQRTYASIFRSLAQRLVGKDAPELAAYDHFSKYAAAVNSRVCADSELGISSSPENSAFF